MQLVLKIFFPSCTELKSAATDGAKTIFFKSISFRIKIALDNYSTTAVHLVQDVSNEVFIQLAF